MKNPDQEKQAPDETTVLHMDQFAPSKPGQPPPTEDPATEEGMTVFIQRAAAETAASTKEPIIVPKNAQGLAAKDMLGAVSYAYAKDVFESERIEDKMRQDPNIREKLGENVPDAQSIRKFRKLNRSAIMQTIEKALRFKRRKDKEDMSKPLPGQPVTAVTTPVAMEDGENTVFFSKKQAEQKLENAIILDNLSKEQ